MTADEPPFRPRDLVRRKAQPDVVGSVVRCTFDEQHDEWMVQVQFGTSLRGLPADLLECVPENRSAWSELGQGRCASATAFRSLMTFERLRRAPSRLASSFGSARAVFLPYQFKPLLKFLESPRQRLLVADDVGLGKTIEAGYILRELRARHNIERVLIVVPARLRTKWKHELEQRFDERFELVRRAELKTLEDMARGNREDSFLWITSYESARSKKFIELLQQAEPSIDLVIIDEAHRLRNPDTLQHALGAALSDCAESMLLLTATPIQTDLANLYNLLRILDSSTFFDVRAFRRLDEANRPVVRALRALRASPPDFGAARAAIQEFAQNSLTAGLAREPFFQSIVGRLDDGSASDRARRVELERDITELSPTGSYTSRTRKREVVKDRPRREAQVVPVHLTPEEREIYDSVGQICRELRPDLDDVGMVFMLLTAYRMTASCIPAALVAFRRRLEDSRSSLASELDSLEEEDLDGEQDGPNTAIAMAERRLLASMGVGSVPAGLDSKFDAFVGALKTIWADDAAERRATRKVIVFSFFKGTLAYLSRRLTALGIGHRLISGDVPMREREVRIEEFANDRSVRVLLSSEVGSEGIDLQFASVVVNYDLPWNPMVVEQRIGRIDRIGQEARRLVIANLVVSDTVEENILLRLYDRIGLFEDAVGDIDPIVGQKIETLTIRALRGDLTRDEMRQLADETADAVCREEREARRLSDESEDLIAADQAFLDEVNRLAGSRKVPSPDELVAFLNQFFAGRYPGLTLPVAAASGVAEVAFAPALGADLRARFGGDPAATRFAGRVQGGPFLVTLDQTSSTRYPRAELIYLRHPLVRFAQECLGERPNDLHRAFSMVISREHLAVDVPLGLYAFAVALLEIGGSKPRTEILPLAVRVEGFELATEDVAEALYLAALVHGDSHLRPPSLAEGQLARCEEGLQTLLQQLQSKVVARERELDEVRATRRRATVLATSELRVERNRERLATFEAERRPPFAIQMAKRKLEKSIHARDEAVASMGQRERFGVEHEVVAVALLDVVE